MTPQHNALVGCKKHLLVTLQSKMVYEMQEDKNGKKKPVKLGLQPIMRDGIEYEFDVYAEIGIDHTLEVSKTSCLALDGYRVQKAGEELASKLWEWTQGEEAPEKPEPIDQYDTLRDQTKGGLNQFALLAYMSDTGITKEELGAIAPGANGKGANPVAWLDKNPDKTIWDLLELAHDGAGQGVANKTR